MKGKVKYYINNTLTEKEINYIPVRYIIAIAITLFEVLAMIGIVEALCYYVPYFYILAWMTEIACIISIIASDDNPDYKVPWLLLVMILPVAGFMLYFIFYSRKLKKKFIKRMNDLKNSSYKKNDDELFGQLKNESPTAYTQAKMLCNISESHLFSDTKQTYFPIGEDMHRNMLEDLKKAVF